MLKAHFAAVEEGLLALAKIPANAGHSIHIGTPREVFVRHFLTSHLSERAAIGTGELIDAKSKPAEARNQHDIVLYKREYPRLDFGGEIYAFLAESVVATIEVKSTLTEIEFNKAYTAAVRAKALEQHVVQAMTWGYQPPAIVNYVVAYAGPVQMQTVYGWLETRTKSDGSSVDPLPKDDVSRVKVASPGLDGVYVLGVGFVQFDNTQLSLVHASRAYNPVKWVVVESVRDNLLALWLHLTLVVGAGSTTILDPLPYLTSAKYTVSWRP